jgi:hypothetical protein
MAATKAETRSEGASSGRAVRRQARLERGTGWLNPQGQSGHWLPAASPWTKSHSVERAGAGCGGSTGAPRCARIFSITARCSMSPPGAGGRRNRGTPNVKLERPAKQVGPRMMAGARDRAPVCRGLQLARRRCGLRRLAFDLFMRRTTPGLPPAAARREGAVVDEEVGARPRNHRGQFFQQFDWSELDRSHAVAPRSARTPEASGGRAQAEHQLALGRELQCAWTTGGRLSNTVFFGEKLVVCADADGFAGITAVCLTLGSRRQDLPRERTRLADCDGHARSPTFRAHGSPATRR